MNTTTCPAGAALKPSQRLLDASLTHYTCSVCGAPCDEHTSSGGLYTNDSSNENEDASMKTITLDDKTYTLSDDLANRIKAEIEAQDVKPKRWRADRDEEYWTLGSDGTSLMQIESALKDNNYHYHTGNYFQTEAEAEAYRDRLLAEQVIRDSSDFVPDWKDEEQIKHRVYYNHFHNRLGVGWSCQEQFQTLAHYRTKEEAKAAIQDPTIRKAYLTVFGVEEAR